MRVLKPDDAPKATEPADLPLAVPVSNDALHVVGLGASAGGLEALECFFEHVPEDSGLAFVAIQHLSPDFKSHMSELIGRKTNIPVHLATEGLAVERNNIYLIPANTVMVISAGKLRLTERSPDDLPAHPIDHFFRSLANDAGQRAVAVILSGTGSDGSRGVRSVNDAGGLVLCQDDTTARFNGMPLNALATGAVHLVLAPEAMPAAIDRYVRHTLTPRALEDEETQASSSTMTRIFQAVQNIRGVDFSHYKPSTVGRRVQRRMSMLQITELPEYAEYVSQNPPEAEALYKDLLIGVTRFFRDTDAFELVEQRIIPAIVARGKQTNSIRIWVAGCASGEEVYSLAILLREQLVNLPQVVVKIFATDIHQGSLDAATRGHYPHAAMSEVSEARKAQFFTEATDGWQVSADLRNMVVFAAHNVFSDAPFTQLDFVSCRNLLIYLQPPAQKKALSLFHFALKTNGYLFLGPSETPGEIDDEFNVIDARHRLYQKRRDVRLPIESRVPYAQGRGHLPRAATSVQRLPRQDSHEASLLPLYDTLLNEYMPPSILVDETYNILHLFSGAERYLQFRAGRPSNIVLDNVSNELRITLAGAMQHALRESGEVRYSGLTLNTHLGAESILLTVKPVIEEHANRMNLLIVLTPQNNGTQPRLPAPESAAQEVDLIALNEARFDGLETELRYTRENLQATIEELETSNEELQAANEEMLASNEELNSTNEELQSVNEELFTVNTEHQSKIVELTTATDDMSNLLALTRVGVIFIDKDLCIRRFTPEIGRSFNLLPQDIGRPVETFSSSLRYSEMMMDLKRAIEHQTEVERSVYDNDENPYLIRIAPFHRTEDVSGAVMTLIGIAEIDRARKELAKFQYMSEQARDGQALVDRESRFVYVNPAYARMTGYDPEELLTMRVGDVDLFHSAESVRALYDHSLTETIDVFDGRLRRKDDQLIDIEVSVNSVTIDDKTLLFAAVRDVTQQHADRVKLTEAEELVSSLVESTSTGIFVVDKVGEFTFCNPAMLSMLGYAEDFPMVGNSLVSTLVGEDEESEPGHCPDLIMAWQRMRPIRQGEGRFASCSGASIDVEYNGQPISADDAVIGYVVSFNDITHRRQQQHRLLAAMSEAKAANRAKSEFLANMSHELRTPLTAIMGHTDLLRLSIEDRTVQEGTESIKLNAGHLLDIVNDILDLSKIEADKIDIQPEVISIPAFLSELDSMMAARAHEKALSFETGLSGDVPEAVVTDHLRLRQIVINLIYNAIKFTEHGEIRVELEYQVPELIIHVIDTGVGIEHAEQTIIFDPFVQGRDDTADFMGGTGLGLSICERLAKRLDGSISVQSVLGQGSNFTVKIPVDVPDDAGFITRLPAPRPASPETVDALNVPVNGTVLVVDDQPEILMLVSKLLERVGATVLSTRDGQEAVELILTADSPVDLVLMDIQMPRKSGIEAATELRDHGYSGQLIALTAQAMKGDRERILAAGFNDYVSKPIDLPALLSKVRASLCSESRDVERKSLRLLFVEDHRDTARVLQRLMTRAGHETAVAFSGADANRVADEQTPDICFVDIHLPDTNGVDLMQQLRSRPAWNGVQFVALTGEIPSEGDQFYLDAGFAMVLIKPVDNSQLSQAVDQLRIT